MRFKKQFRKNNRFIKSVTFEDLHYLQKKISGRSVYGNGAMYYSRKPKHRNEGYQY